MTDDNRSSADRFRAGQERMRHTPEPAEPIASLPAGGQDDAYPLNEQAADDFNVGGVERSLPPGQQLEQLVSYMHATYPAPTVTPPWRGGDGDPDPADRYMAHLSDRITHASMLMLGSALDHTMPGVAYPGDVDVREIPELSAHLFVPSTPSGRWAISLHPGGWWRGGGIAREFRWQPEVAAAAELSGTTILDLDYPLAPAHDVAAMVEHVTRALQYVLNHDPASIALWGGSSGAVLATLFAESDSVDALALTYPAFDSLASLPDDLRAGFSVPAPESWPRTLLQVALADEVAGYPDTVYTSAEQVEVVEYRSTHSIATPEESRRRIRDVADFLRSTERR